MENRTLRISFNPNATTYGCGHALDTFLYAYGLQTEEELYEQLGDLEFETRTRVIDQFDYRTFVRDELNDKTASNLTNLLFELKMPVGVVSSHEIESSEYLPGDWLQINHPEAFNKLVEKKRNEIKSEVQEDWENERIPKIIRDRMQSAIDDLYDYEHNVWLEGDRQNMGALEKLIREIFDSRDDNRIQWDQKTDTLIFSDISEGELRTMYGYDLGDEEKLPEVKEIEEYLKARVITRCRDRRREREAASKARLEEWERRRASQVTDSDREREEARQRKLKKLGSQ